MNLFQRRAAPVPMVMQDAPGECGLASMAMIASALGHRFDLAFLRQRYPSTARGLTFARLAEIAGELGMNARAFALADVAELARVSLPALLHWDRDHFVVLTSVRRGRFRINNPAFGTRVLEAADVRRHFSGHLMEFEAADDFVRIVSNPRLTVAAVLRVVSGLSTSAAQVASISIATAAISLLLPVIVQVALDDVVPRHDAALLAVLASAYMAASLVSAIGEWYRQRILLNAGTSFVAQFTRNVVGHLFRLPLRYFESRHPADVTVRLDSIDHIKTVVVQSMVTAMVDAVMLALSAAMMFAYAPLLGALIVGTLAFVGAIRLLAFPRIARLGGAALKARSEERSHLIDNIRAIVPLRVGTATARANGRWYGALLRHLNAEFRVGRTEANLAFWLHVVVAAGTSATLYLGVLAVLANQLTIGMLYAFFTFRTLFFERLESAVAATIQVTMLSANMSRLRDFTEEDVEEQGHWSRAGRGGAREALALKKVGFRIGASDRWILSEVDLEVNLAVPETIGIVGPSGAGKSTLFKLLAGLYPASEGKVSVDDQPIGRFGLERYRSGVGLVLGADKLFRGTIVQNVTGMALSPDYDHLNACLATAALLDEVEDLPWQLETVVSEESSLLSTGQRRRLMLARALYARPKLLLLDELASNLDPETTAAILRNLGSVEATKLISSHVASIIPGCDRYFRIAGGRLTRLTVQDGADERRTRA